MKKFASTFLFMALLVTVNSQLFNDLIQGLKPSKTNSFEKTINFDTIKLNERPKGKNDYLPPETPGYLPPKSTPGPLYLPPITTQRTTYKPISYMPTMGTFPPTRYYNYTTRITTTRKPMPAPITLRPITTTIRTTTGYYYEKPKEAFEYKK